MNIAYFIFSNEKGTGGHHHSLKSIRKALIDHNNSEVFIFNLGAAPSPVLSDLVNYKFFRINSFNILIKIFQLLLYCKKKNIDILHAFDVNAYFYVRIISFILKIPSIYTKCGGPNGKYNPKSVFGITFSGENYIFLKNKRIHNNIFLIENRVPKFTQNKLEVIRIREQLKINDEIIFLRVIRISSYYESSIFKTVYFVSKIKNSILVFLGSVYNNDLKLRIINLAKKESLKVIFIDDEKYTKDAKQFLDVGDILFGTGRSAMEIMSLKKPLLSYVKNCEYPILVDKSNFDSFKFFNFSERVEVKEVPSIEKTIQFIENNKILDENSSFLFNNFELNYDVNTKIDLYLEIYNSTLKSKITLFFFKDFIKNSYVHFLRVFLSSNRYYKNKK